MRTGIGFDIHRIVPSLRASHIPLGGVDIPCYLTVQAHSDGDVLLHAAVDACLGALALGDIGQWFPNSDEKNRNRKSTEFLKQAIAEIHRLGHRVANLDSVVYLEEPRLAEHSDAIRRSLAEILKVELSQVSLKAKTMEGLGAIGDGKAIAAHVMVSLEKI